MNKRRLLCALVWLAAAPCLTGCFSSYSGARSFEAEYRDPRVFVLDTEQSVSLDITSRIGRVDVAAHGEALPDWLNETVDIDVPEFDETQTLVIAILQSDGANRVERATLEPSIDGANKITLKTQWPGRGVFTPQDGVDYIVRAPSINAFRTRIDITELVARDVQGEVDVRADIGEIDITMTDENPGPVRITLAIGDVDITAGPELFGPLELDVNIGSVALIGSRGDYEKHSGMLSEHISRNDGKGGPQSYVRVDIGEATARLRKSDDDNEHTRR